MKPGDLFPARIARRIEETSSECWHWLGAKTNEQGHGRVWWRGRMVLVHRLAVALARGRVPSGKMVCHLCDNPPCCNPEHLMCGSSRTNQLHRFGRGRRRRPLELAA